LMDKKTIKQLAWVGEEFLKGPIKGVVLVFHGLGFAGMKEQPSTEELEWAAAGWLVVFPYYGPWTWMNRNARAFMDDLVDSIYREYGLGPDVPLISTGGSMGGCSSLIYTRYAKRPVRACLALFPVCDLKLHFSERPDLPRTILYAFRGYREDMESVFAEHSPLAQVENMPAIPYLLIHGDQDEAVAKHLHSDPMVAAMRRHGLDVEYMEVPGMMHGDRIPLAVVQRQVDFVNAFLKK
jgi:dipeptidyl aminopeptidase/acylaminoacyl peptidase